MYKHAMLDLETLAVTPNAVVTAIGLVLFDLDSAELGPVFYRVLTDWDDQQKRGRVIQADTVAWWLGQPQEAVAAMLHPDPTTATATPFALRELAEFLEGLGEISIWGNGVGFDNAILANLYKTYGMPAPWTYKQDRCFRTAVSLLAPRGWKLPRIGIHHCARDDAMHQARMLQALHQQRAAACAPALL